MMKRSAKTLVREATEKELEKRRNAIVIEVLVCDIQQVSP